MANVNLVFGGDKPCTWANYRVVVDAYLSLAVQYGLELKQHGLSFLYEEGTVGVLKGIQFWYIKNGMPESQLEAFFNTWKTLAASNAFTRLPTTVNYIEG